MDVVTYFLLLILSCQKNNHKCQLHVQYLFTTVYVKLLLYTYIYIYGTIVLCFYTFMSFISICIQSIGRLHL